MGRHVMFADNDLIFLKNPMDLLLKSDLDMYGLSDLRNKKINGEGDMPYCSLEYGWPCQSTGLWVVKSNNHTIALFEEFLSVLESTDVWEQEAFNIYLKEKLQSADKKPLIKYDLFPMSYCANIGVTRQRCQMKLDAASYAVHMGFLHGADKLNIFVSLSECLKKRKTLCQCLSFSSHPK